MSQRPYLCDTWQAFIQQIVNYLNHGYHRYDFALLPEQKRQYWASVDNKLIQRFDANKPRGKRYHDKKKGIINYVYLRCENMNIIMHSPGEETDINRLNHPFKDIQKHPILIRPKNGELELAVTKADIKKGGKVGFTVKLSKACYRDLKALFMELLDKRQLKSVMYRFNALNGIPAYAGINKQKKLLEKIIRNYAKEKTIDLKQQKFRRYTKLKQRKVYIS